MSSPATERGCCLIENRGVIRLRSEIRMKETPDGGHRLPLVWVPGLEDYLDRIAHLDSPFGIIISRERTVGVVPDSHLSKVPFWIRDDDGRYPAVNCFAWSPSRATPDPVTLKTPHWILDGAYKLLDGMGLARVDLEFRAIPLDLDNELAVRVCYITLSGTFERVSDVSNPLILAGTVARVFNDTIRLSSKCPRCEAESMERHSRLFFDTCQAHRPRFAIPVNNKQSTAPMKK